MLPIMPAVVIAVYDAVGVRVDEIPITPEKIHAALERKAKGKEARVGPVRVPDVRWPEPIRVRTPWQGGTGEPEPSGPRPALRAGGGAE